MQARKPGKQGGRAPKITDPVAANSKTHRKTALIGTEAPPTGSTWGVLQVDQWTIL
jgi:hypothetical protein